MDKGAGLLCPNCGSNEHQVKDSRPGDRAIRRRRLCKNCFARFTTYEVCAAHADALERAVYFGEIFGSIPTPRRRIIEQMLVEFGKDVPPSAAPPRLPPSARGWARLQDRHLARALPQPIEVEAFNLIEAVEVTRE